MYDGRSLSKNSAASAAFRRGGSNDRLDVYNGGQGFLHEWRKGKADARFILRVYKDRSGWIGGELIGNRRAEQGRQSSGQNEIPFHVVLVSP